ncbi:hypothetical protein [Jeotgalibacillus soli]|nr:hypothetical protein [Jeotgalibacillus soli]
MIRAMRRQYGRHDYVRFTIDEMERHHEDEKMVVVTFKEHHDDGENITHCFSSTVLIKSPFQPNGLEWLHVHKTRTSM